MKMVDGNDRLPIHEAADSGCMPIVELAVAMDPLHIERSDAAGWTPLMTAVSAGRYEVARYLLMQPECDVNHRYVVFMLKAASLH